MYGLRVWSGLILCSLAGSGCLRLGNSDSDGGVTSSADGGGTEQPRPDGGTSSPDGAVSTYDSGVSPELVALAEKVIANQEKGKRFAEIAAENGKVTLDDGTVVKLQQSRMATCPDTITDCNVSDSAALGIPSGNLIVSTAALRPTVKSQGERSTCVSFATSAALELLLARAGSPADISEQTTYLLGKATQATTPADWEEPGLWPDVMLESFTKNKTKLVTEDRWPYNAKEDCGEYLKAHPGKTCYANDVQGGGAEHHDPDPATVTAPGYAITSFERLYASLGRVKKALASNHPVVLSVGVNSDFNIATKKEGTVSWIFKASSCGSCGHAILALGYMDHPSVEGGGFLIVKNSWGDDWGDGGLAYLTYEWLSHNLQDGQAIKAFEAVTR